MGSRPGLSSADRLLTTREVAEFLGLSPETVLRRWRSGELPGSGPTCSGSARARSRRGSRGHVLNGPLCRSGGGVVFKACCGLGTHHTLRVRCENARGLRAGALIAVLGGLRARREGGPPCPPLPHPARHSLRPSPPWTRPRECSASSSERTTRPPPSSRRLRCEEGFSGTRRPSLDVRLERACSRGHGVRTRPDHGNLGDDDRGALRGVARHRARCNPRAT